MASSCLDVITPSTYNISTALFLLFKLDTYKKNWCIYSPSFFIHRLLNFASKMSLLREKPSQVLQILEFCEIFSFISLHFTISSNPLSSYEIAFFQTHIHSSISSIFPMPSICMSTYNLDLFGVDKKPTTIF